MLGLCIHWKWFLCKTCYGCSFPCMHVSIFQRLENALMFVLGSHLFELLRCAVMLSIPGPGVSSWR